MQPFHDGLMWHPLLAWLFSRTIQANALCLFVSLPPLHLPHKATVAQTLPLSGCGFKAECWRICSDRARFRAQWQGEGGSSGDVGAKRVVWRRRQMNQREKTSSGINIITTLADTIDWITDSFLNCSLPLPKASWLHKKKTYRVCVSTWLQWQQAYSCFILFCPIFTKKWNLA